MPNNNKYIKGKQIQYTLTFFRLKYSIRTHYNTGRALICFSIWENGKMVNGRKKNKVRTK